MLQAPHCQRDATGVHGEHEDDFKSRNLGLITIHRPETRPLILQLLQLLNSSLARLLKRAARGGLPGNRGHHRDVWTGSPVVQAGTFRYEPGRRHNPRLTLPLYRTPNRPR